MLQLEARPAPSKAMSLLSPVIALAVTVLVRRRAVRAAGQGSVARPGDVLRRAVPRRVRALRAVREGHAADADRPGPGGLLPRQRLEHRRRGPVRAGRDRGLGRGDARAARLRATGSSCPSCWPASLGGMAWAAIVAFLRDKANASEILVSLMLVYVANQLLNYLVYGDWKDPDGYNFPQTITFLDADQDPAPVHRPAREHRLRRGAAVGRHVLAVPVPRVRRLPDAGGRPGRGGGALRRLLVAPRAVGRAADLGRHGGPGGRVRGGGPDRPADAATCRRATASPRSSWPTSAG